MIAEETHHRLEMLRDAFLRENAKINLSAFRTLETCWTGNILDSLAALESEPLRSLSTLVPNLHPCLPAGRPPSPSSSSLQVPIPDPSPGTSSIPKPLPPSLSQTSIPRPLPPEEEGEYRREHTCRPYNQLSFAREMRKHPTEAENILWEHLRNDALAVRFRRQFLCAGFIFDFYCPEYRLAVEVDGDIHQSQSQSDSDRARDAFVLAEFSVTTLRFSNDQVFHELDSILSTIQKHIHSPSPRERGLGGEVYVKKEEGLGGEVCVKKEEGLGGEVESLKILDLGTGGGFPLLPLALSLPQCTFVGMDSVQKKVAAVQRIIDAVKIPNVSLVCGRSEELARESAHREQYDFVLVRALAALNVLLELAAPFVKVGGHILCWKSLKIDQELQDSLLARSEMSCQIEKPYAYDLGGNWGRRQILVFRKRAKTHAKYPREVGEPKKNPLL